MREQPDKQRDLAPEWCTKHGLLGILTTFPDKLLSPPSIEELGTEWYKATQLRYLRTGGIWRREDLSVPLSTEREWVAEEARRLDVPPPDWPSSFNRWSRDTYADRRMSSQFFPLAGFENIPLPNSRDFFRVYGEPVWEIAQWAMAFERQAVALSKEDIQAEDFQHALAFLTEVASAASPTFQRYRDGKVEEVRVSAGLLASFALMVLWDFEEGRRVHACKNCKNYFVSKDQRAGYCSVTCRNTAQSRRYRAKKKNVSFPKGV
jgi:hypothetical protein